MHYHNKANCRRKFCKAYFASIDLYPNKLIHYQPLQYLHTVFLIQYLLAFFLPETKPNLLSAVIQYVPQKKISINST